MLGPLFWIQFLYSDDVMKPKQSNSTCFNGGNWQPAPGDLQRSWNALGQPELSSEKVVPLCWAGYQVHSLRLRERWERISGDAWPKSTQKIYCQTEEVVKTCQVGRFTILTAARCNSWADQRTCLFGASEKSAPSIAHRVLQTRGL